MTNSYDPLAALFSDDPVVSAIASLGEGFLSDNFDAEHVVTALYANPATDSFKSDDDHRDYMLSVLAAFAVIATYTINELQEKING